MKDNFRDYYLTMFGNLEEIHSVVSVIDFISEINFDYRIHENYFIATFSSFLNIKEIEDLVRGFKHDFVLVEMDGNFSFNFSDKETENEIFGLLNTDEKYKSEDITNKLIEDILDSRPESDNDSIFKKFNRQSRRGSRRQTRLKSEYYKNLTKREKEEMVNNILDKGFDNISDYDRRVLTIISKSE